MLRRGRGPASRSMTPASNHGAQHRRGRRNAARLPNEGEEAGRVAPSGLHGSPTPAPRAPLRRESVRDREAQSTRRRQDDGGPGEMGERGSCAPPGERPLATKPLGDLRRPQARAVFSLVAAQSPVRAGRLAVSDVRTLRRAHLPPAPRPLTGSWTPRPRGSEFRALWFLMIFFPEG